MEGDDRVSYEKKRERTKTRSGKRKNIKDTDWILKKKELYRARGKADVPRDSKCVWRRVEGEQEMGADVFHPQVHCKEPKTSILGCAAQLGSALARPAGL